jgi:hypothetical protein
VSDTTTNHVIPFMEGDDAASDIDQGFQDLAEHLDDLIVVKDSGTLASRPVSTPGSPGIEGRVYRVVSGSGAGCVMYDHGTGWVTVADPDPGLLASRPAANALPAGTRYRSTDKGDVSETDGTIWFTLTPAAMSSFVARSLSADNVAQNTPTKLSATTEDHDANAEYDAASSRFTAKVKGLYSITANVNCGTGAATENLVLSIHKNGSQITGPLNEYGVLAHITIHRLVALDINDYVEIYGHPSNGVGTRTCVMYMFCGHLVTQLP